MWPFRPSLDSDPVAYLCRLMEEQNTLLRELLAATGHPSWEPSARRQIVPPRAPRTAADVMRVTREEVIAQERLRQERLEAPWRQPPIHADAAMMQAMRKDTSNQALSGPASAGTGSTSGRTSATDPDSGQG